MYNFYLLKAIVKKASCGFEVNIVILVGIFLALIEACTFLIVPDYVKLIISEREITASIIVAALFFLFLRGLLFASGQYVLSVNSYKIKAKIVEAIIEATESKKEITQDKSIVQILTTEAGHLVGYVIAPLSIIFSEFMVISFIVISLAFSFGGSAISSAASLVIVALAYHASFRNMWRKISQKRINIEQSRTKMIVEWVSLLDTIKISSKPTLITKNLKKLNFDVSRLEGIQYFGIQLPKLWLELFGVPAILIAIYWTSNSLDLGSTIALLVSAGLAAFRIIPSLNRFLASVQTLQYAGPVLERFSDILHNVNAIIKSKHVNIQLHTGEKLVIIGESGSGKTTAIKKLLFTDSIFVEKDGAFIPPKHISYLSQGHEIFTGKIDENIKFFCNVEVDDRKIKTILETFNLKNLLIRFQRNEQISPETTSGGEKARLSLARCFNSEAELIVLDEPTNALDEKNVEFVKLLISECSKPLIIISHDRRIIELATSSLNIEELNVSST